MSTVPEGHSITSLPHYSSSHYANGWGASDSELPLTKHGSTMNFAEDEFDEARQLHHPSDDDFHGKQSLLSNWMGPSQEGLSQDHPGKFAWTNPELLQRQIDRRMRGEGRQKLPLVSWFLAYVPH